MKTTLLLLAFLILSISSFASDFKKQKIELDDAPIAIAEQLEGHEIKTVIHYIDKVSNQSYYMVKSKKENKSFKTTFSATGDFESQHRRAIIVPVIGGVLFLLMIAFSFAS